MLSQKARYALRALFVLGAHDSDEPMMIADIAAAQISIALGVRGPNFCTTSACSSGSDAIGVAYELIKHGDTPVMVAGGAESIINPLGITAFSQLKNTIVKNPDGYYALQARDYIDGILKLKGISTYDFIRQMNEIVQKLNTLGDAFSFGGASTAPAKVISELSGFSRRHQRSERWLHLPDHLKRAA